jgi:5-methylcytosine-specific restriction endonuclease McrA
VLRLSEHEAYGRITAARAARRYPQLLDLLADGALTLSSVGLLSPHLTGATVETLLNSARFKSTREVERLIAAAFPQADVPTTLRALPKPASVAATAQMSPLATAEAPPADTSVLAASRSKPRLEIGGTTRPVLAPIAARRYLLKVTLSEDTQDKLRRVRDLLRHSIPAGDVDQILDRALTELLSRVVRSKVAGAQRRGERRVMAVASGRRIPSAVRRSVWERDGGRCVFAGADGVCGETAFLEFRHLVPFAAGGASVASNLELRCRAHNAYDAKAHFGSGAHASGNSARAE